MERDLTVLFDGFGGVNIGAEAAGVKVIRGFENDSSIASVSQKNLNHELVIADILHINPKDYEPTWALHASPPCPNFSIAKAGATETPHDAALGSKISEFIKTMLPKVFTLENVYLYRYSESWAQIRDTLNQLGYWHDLAHVNAVDFGVPQTRKRMVVRAIRDGWVPQFPSPEKWQGWYQAIEDLIPTLPESQFAPWQIARLPKNYQDVVDTFIIGQGFRARKIPLGLRAFLMAGGGNTNLKDAEPMRGVITNNKPSHTVTTLEKGGTFPRAFIINSQNSRQGGKLTIRDDSQPMTTVTATSHKAQSRAWLSQGKVVSMTTRALARFQTFPDSYILPENKTLACKGIGNAVPPLLYEKIIRGLI